MDSNKNMIGFEISENTLEPVQSNIFEKVMGRSYFQEMSGRLPRDPSCKCNLVVAVGDREKEIAHFHVFRNETDKEKWKKGAYNHGEITNIGLC